MLRVLFLAFPNSLFFCLSLPLWDYQKEAFISASVQSSPRSRRTVIRDNYFNYLDKHNPLLSL